MRLTKAESAKIRAARLKRGDCPQCGRKPDDPRFKTCGACRERSRRRTPRERLRALSVRKAKKRLGLCSENGCDAEAVPGLRVCGYHAELRAERSKLRRQRLRDAGLCYVCGKPPVPGRRACASCGAKDRARVKRHTESKKAGAIRLPMAAEVQR